MEKISSFLILEIYFEQPSFPIGMRSSALARIFMRNTTIHIATFLAPSYSMDVPSRVILKSKMGLS